MAVISVVTAVYEGGHKFLPEAYDSLRRQELPAGWSWEWIVQEDGQTGVPASGLPDDPRIKTGQARPGGAGVARTMALASVSGRLVRALDADDLLTEGALQRDIETLTQHPEAGWCISSCLDLLPDGSMRPGPYDPPPGPLSYEDLMESYRADRFPVVGTHLTAHTELMHAVGGWPALPACEALALVLYCAAVSPGLMIGAPGGVYRKHPAQTTAQHDYYVEEEFRSLKRVITIRSESLRAAGWTWNSCTSERTAS